MREGQKDQSRLKREEGYSVRLGAGQFLERFR